MAEVKSAEPLSRREVVYTAYFGLTEPPFSITPDPRYLYMSARHTDALAHLVYGISESGGFIQLTGRANYRSYGQKLGVPLEAQPDLALDAAVAARVLATYMRDRNLGALAGKGDWQGVRRGVNGGLNGWDRFSSLVTKLQQATWA